MKRIELIRPLSTTEGVMTIGTVTEQRDHVADDLIRRGIARYFDEATHRRDYARRLNDQIRSFLARRAEAEGDERSRILAEMDAALSRV